MVILPDGMAHHRLHFRAGTVKRRYDYRDFTLLDIDLGGGNVATVQDRCVTAA